VFLIISAITFNIPDVIASILYILSFSFNKKNLDTVETIVSKQLDFSMNQTTRARVIGK
jgi:hypothetical protein